MRKLLELWSQISLGTRAAIFIGLFVAFTASGVVVAAYWVLSGEFLSRAGADIEINLRTLARVYSEAHKDATLKFDGDKLQRVEEPAMPAFSDHAIVDRTVAYAGGTATIFAYDPASNNFVRRTTNVKNEKGERAIGTKLADDHPAQPVLRRGEAYKGPAVLFGRKFYTAYQPVFGADGKVIGILYVGNSIESYDELLTHTIRSMVTVAGIGTLLVILLTTWLVRRSLRPLGAVTRTLSQLADGQLDAEVAHTERRDEIGAIARAIAVFRDSATRARQLEAEERRNAESERTRATTITGLTRAFEQRIDKVLGGLGTMIAGLETDAEGMAASAASTKDHVTTAAQAAEQANSNVRSVATATEELSSAVGEIGRQAGTSAQIASRAVEEVRTSNARVNDLSEMARKIGEVVTLIKAIAAQTNLLALNATIEAARAGEAGKGFAVVASEVKSLATQTGKATEEIASQIERMQQATEGAVSAIAGISDTIANIDGIAAAIAAAVDQQRSATADISRGVDNAAGEAEKVRAIIAEVDGVARDAAQTSATVSGSAKAMAKELRELDHELRDFLVKVQAA
jgi:methyl-accepting chemotaxis protein